MEWTHVEQILVCPEQKLVKSSQILQNGSYKIFAASYLFVWDLHRGGKIGFAKWIQTDACDYFNRCSRCSHGNMARSPHLFPQEATTWKQRAKWLGLPALHLCPGGTMADLYGWPCLTISMYVCLYIITYLIYLFS